MHYLQIRTLNLDGLLGLWQRLKRLLRLVRAQTYPVVRSRSLRLRSRQSV